MWVLGINLDPVEEWSSLLNHFVVSTPGFNVIFVCVCTFVNICHVYMGACGSQKRTSELDIYELFNMGAET